MRKKDDKPGSLGDTTQRNDDAHLRSGAPTRVTGGHKISRTQLLRRLSRSAALPALVQRLEPRVLHKLIAVVGLNDATEIMAVAPVQKLVAALDLAVWKNPQAGEAEVFVADAFTNWLEAWLDIGEAFTAERLLALGEEYLGTALAALIEVESIHVRGFEGRYGWKLEQRFEDAEADDRGGFDTRTADELAHDARWCGDELDAPLRDAPLRPRDEADDFDRDTRIWADAAPAPSSPTDQAFFGEYLVGGITDDEWDVVLGALNALWAAAPDTLLAILGRLAANASMIAVGDHRAVLRDDVARARELAQVAKGFVTPLGARAFFAWIASCALDDLLADAGYDNETAQYFLRVRAANEAAAAAAIHDAQEDDDGSSDHAFAAETLSAAEPAANAAQALTQSTAAELAELQQLLADAGVGDAGTAPTRVAAQLTATNMRRSRGDVRAAIAAIAAEDPEAAAQRMQELAYLANTVVMGLHRDGREIAEADAAEIVLATVNLGLDWLDRQAPTLATRALSEVPGVVRAFGIGWRLVRELPSQLVEACRRGLSSTPVTEKLARKPWLQREALAGLTDLERCVREQRYDGAREALTLLSLVLDANACRALRSALNAVPQITTGDRADDIHWIASLDDLQRMSESMRQLG